MAGGRRGILAGGFALLGTMLARPSQAAGQHGTTHHGAGPAPHGPRGHAAAAGCEAEFKQVVGDGRGFGMAFVADRNGYPGPMHVLELKTELGLSAEQEQRARELYDRVMAERGRSTRLLEAEQRLERLFVEGAVTEPGLRAAVAEIERARTEVRLVHLLAHVQTRDFLTPAQRATYHRARWSARP